MKIELLAPAGNLNKCKIAILYGADAVYIGGKQFSLRARASNFSLNDIEEACKFVHQHHKKIYVTMNILPHNQDLDGLDEYLKFLEKTNVDAIIVSSLAILNRAKEVAPKLEIHMSTQLSIANHKAIEFYQSQGASRIVLARELDLKQIKEIKNNTNIGLEVFIHGGMCSSFSGRCMLSNYMVNRDANRGGCAHSCRWNYIHYPSQTSFHMGSKDLSLVAHIKDLINIGVESLKIEGRMKSEYYIATVVRAYRKLIDNIINDNNNINNNNNISYYIDEIKKAENRDCGKGFIDGDVTIEEQLYDRDDHPTKEFVGRVLDYDEKTSLAMIEQRNYFTIGDELEFFGPNLENTKWVVTNLQDENNQEIEIARHPKEILYLNLPFVVHKDDMIRLVKNS